MGYDLAEPQCRFTCQDKHSCLAAAIDDGTSTLAIEDDHEVSEVLRGQMSATVLAQRVASRAQILGDDPEQFVARLALIPAALLVRKAHERITLAGVVEAPAAKPKPKRASRSKEATQKSPLVEDAKAKAAKAAEDANVVEPEDEHLYDPQDSETEDNEQGETEMKKKTLKRPAAKKSEPKAAKPKLVRPKKAPKAPRNEPGGPKAKLPASMDLTPNPHGTGKVFGAKGWPTVIAGGKLKPLPKPRVLDAKAMQEALDRVKIGLPFDLKVGMRIVRHRRNGKNPVVVEVKADGFLLDGEQKFASLTACALWAERRMRSGNDYFSVEVHDCVEVIGKDVPGGTFKRGSAA
jgi:hypothetical protein